MTEENPVIQFRDLLAHAAVDIDLADEFVAIMRRAKEMSDEHAAELERYRDSHDGKNVIQFPSTKGGEPPAPPSAA